MKYICLGYIEPKKFENMSESERNAMVDACWAYDDELRKGGHFAGGEGLQPPQTAATLRWTEGKVAIVGEDQNSRTVPIEPTDWL